MKRNEPKYAEALTVMEAIHGDTRFGLMAMDREEGTNHAWPVKTCFDDASGHASRFADYAKQGFEPFIMVGVSDEQEKGFGNNNITKTWAVAVDCDDGMPSLFHNPLLMPSLLIETSPGRYQAVWIFDEVQDTTTYQRLLRCMAVRMETDLAHAKISQIVRLPGFVNRKHGTVSCLMPESVPDKYFKVDFLLHAFDADLMARTVQQAVPRFNDNLAIAQKGYDREYLVQDLSSALTHLSKESEGYLGWVNVMMALVPLGADGEALARDFSKQSSKFDENTFAKKWAQLQSQSYPGKPATIFLMAQRAGWKNPGFRKQSPVQVQMVTDREFGRLVAGQMHGSIAVLEGTSPADKRRPVFLQWNGETYSTMKEVTYRAAVEKAGGQVITSLAEAKTMDKADTIKFTQKLGANRSLMEVCEHVAEAVVLDSERRVVKGYPYLGVANGVLNLLNQELIPAKFRAICPISAPVTFNPSAKAPVFENALNIVFQGNEELIRYFIRVMGYAILGRPVGQVFFILYGPTANNGKSKLIEAMRHVLGPYATILNTTTIMTKSNVSDGATPSLADLENRRVAIVSEPNRKHKIDSGMVKQMTGDESMSVRRIYENSKDMTIEFVMVLPTNFMPEVPDDDQGLWRRIRVIPFNHSFTKEDMDEHIGDKFKKEASGILNLMLRGIRDYQQNGLAHPDIVMSEVKKQREAADPVEAFLEDVMISEVGVSTPLKVLYDELYRDWQKLNLQFPLLTKPDFSKRIEKKGYKKIIRANLPHFHGLRSAADA